MVIEISTSNVRFFAFGIFISLMFLLLTGYVSAMPSEEWNKTLSRGDGDRVNAVTQTLDGGYIIGGTVDSYGSLIKIDTKGNIQWSKTFRGLEEINDVKQTPDGGYIIICKTSDFYGCLIKTDISGSEQWNKTLGGKFDHANNIQMILDENYIIAGTVLSHGAGKLDAWLIKTDVNGNEQWNRTFGGKEDDGANTVIHTSDGGYLIAGWTNSYGKGKVDAWIIKTDTNGNEQWNRTFGGTDIDSFGIVRQTPDNGYIISGNTRSFGAGNQDGWLIKIDANGNMQWNKPYGGTNLDYLSAIFAQGTEYILVGGTKSYGAGGLDVWLIQIDAKGNEQWNMTFGGKNDESVSSFEQTSDGGYLLGGWTNADGIGEMNAWLIKIGSNSIDTKQPINTQPATVQLDINKSSEKSIPGFETTLTGFAIITALMLWRRYSISSIGRKL